MSRSIVQCLYCGAQNVVEFSRPAPGAHSPVFSGRTPPRPKFGATLIKPARAKRVYQCVNCHQKFEVPIS